MQILDRYLRTVKSSLPAAQADDIVKELYENISSQIEDKESELARPLTESEVEVILKQHGHPLLVASRYRHDQRNVSFGRQIIGPMLFPFYVRVLKFNLGLTSVILLVIFGALFAGGQPIGALPQIFLYQLLIQFAIITLLFAVVDRHFAKFPDAWDPCKPSRIPHPALTSSDDGPRIPRAKSVSQLVSLSVALVWLRAVQHSQFLIFGPAAAFLNLSPVWGRFYIPIVALTLLGMMHAGINVIRPDWLRFHWLMSIIERTCGLALCYFLIQAGNLVVAANTTGPMDHPRLVQILNQSFYYGILFMAVIFIVEIAKAVLHLLSTTPNRLAADANH